MSKLASVVFADVRIGIILIIHHRLYHYYYAMHVYSSYTVLIYACYHKIYHDMYFILVNIDEDEMNCENRITLNLL